MARSRFDEVAEEYDATRGGEPRGDHYAEQLHGLLERAPDPIIEVGVGTGVVSLGLRRRGRSVIGVDMSLGMLAKARQRLGSVLTQGDACRLPLQDASVGGAISVWMLHAVAEPPKLFTEVFRVLRPGGRLVMCPTARPSPRDAMGLIIARMFKDLNQSSGKLRDADEPDPEDAEQISAWGEAAGFTAYVQKLEDRRWETSPDEEIEAIRKRRWAVLVDLDEDAYQAITAVTIERLTSLPPGPKERRATTLAVVLDKPP